MLQYYTLYINITRIISVRSLRTRSRTCADAVLSCGIKGLGLAGSHPSRDATAPFSGTAANSPTCYEQKGKGVLRYCTCRFKMHFYIHRWPLSPSVAHT